MRNPDGTLRGDLNDNISATTTGSFVLLASSSLNENETIYDLLPVVTNQPPIVVAPIRDASTPQIKPSAAADDIAGLMYHFPDDTVKVHIGASFTLSIDATQPNIFNVDNGIPIMKQPDTELVYVWKKDGRVIDSYEIDSLQSEFTISDDKKSITFNNVQAEHAGTYTCDVSNDVGTTTSEPINLEVHNTDFNGYFYNNLVRNPYGKNGTEDWESAGLDFTTRYFSNQPSQDYIKPYYLENFGYTVDMVNPRPYQISTELVENYDLTANLLNNGTYFTRTRYKFIKKGGSFLVRAYQDIDLTEVQDFIKGTIFGVDGISAVFSCYIGNALSSFIPSTPLVDPKNRANPGYYVVNRPRVSIENFLNSGPNYGPNEKVYVIVEEFDNETRLASRVLDSSGKVIIQNERVVLYDPWTKAMSSFWSSGAPKYYPIDEFGIGETSSDNPNDRSTDGVLYSADRLHPDINKRFTYGQYVEFNKVVLSQLNRNTTKIRISLQFETYNDELFNTSRTVVNASEEPFELGTYARPTKQHSFQQDTVVDISGSEWIYDRIRKTYYPQKGYSAIPRCQDPRGLVTGLNLCLVPIFSAKPEITNYYVSSIGSKNDTPESDYSTGLGTGRQYDPKQKFTKRAYVDFDHNFVIGSINPTTYEIETKSNIAIKVSQGIKNDSGDEIGRSPIKSTERGIFPFIKDAEVVAEEPQTQPFSRSGIQSIDEYNYWQDYLEIKFGNKNLPDPTANLADYSWTTKNQRQPQEIRDLGGYWAGESVYLLNFAAVSASTPYNINTGAANVSDKRTDIRNTKYQFLLQSYYLRIEHKENTPGSWQQKAVLYRNSDLLPGSGSVSIDCNTTVDSRGIFSFTIPTGLLTASYDNGGLGYRSEVNVSFSVLRNPVLIQGNIYDCIEALKRNVQFAPGSTPAGAQFSEFYKEMVDQVLYPIRRDINTMPSGISNPINIPKYPLYYRIELNNFSANNADQDYDVALLSIKKPSTVASTYGATYSSVKIIPIYASSFIDRDTYVYLQEQKVGTGFNQYSIFNTIETTTKPYFSGFSNTFDSLRKIVKPTSAMPLNANYKYTGSISRQRLELFLGLLEQYAYNSNANATFDTIAYQDVISAYNSDFVYTPEKMTFTDRSSISLANASKLDMDLTQRKPVLYSVRSVPASGSAISPSFGYDEDKQAYVVYYSVTDSTGTTI